MNTRSYLKNRKKYLCASKCRSPHEVRALSAGEYALTSCGLLQLKKFSFTIYHLSFIKVFSVLCVLCVLCGEIPAQVRPVYDYGATGLGQLLKKLNTTKSVMMIGAHPDDEDSALLAYLARGENARTAYLSLTRGDGGQNIIGSELFESLGIIRTEELLQARRLDGAEQFFTRAFDYGFSKTLTEAKQKWDEKIILCDTVRAIRIFRPLVVISRFSGTPADGHGQHQYAGYISPLAVKAAADANQCQDGSVPWQVLKFYVEQGFRDNSQPTLKINTGEYNPLLGRSFFEIAMEGRSQHKTQEQGALELKGDQFSGLNLIETKAPKIENEKSVFDGIDVSLTGAARAFVKNEKTVSDFTKQQLAAIQKSVERANNEFNPNSPRQILPILAEGKKALIAFRNDYNLFSGTQEQQKNNEPRQINESDLRDILDNKRSEFDEAIRLAAGIRMEALTNQETAAPGEEFPAAVKVFYPNDSKIKVKEINLRSNLPTVIPGGNNQATVTKTKTSKENSLNSFRRENANETAYFNVKLDERAEPTQPYWLKEERHGDLFNWQTDYFNKTLPFDIPPLSANATIEVEGTEINLSQPLQYRYADGVRGEIRREFNVVPKLSVALDQKLIIFPYSEKAQTRRVVMTVTNNSDKPVSGTTSFYFSNDSYWKLVSATPDFNLPRKGETARIEFDVTVPARAAVEDHNFSVLAQINQSNDYFSKEMHTIAYPHIQTHRFYTDAKAKFDVLDLKIAPVKVGYIMGSGDEVPEAIRQMNLSVDLLSEKDLSDGNLSKYDVIVAGIRAYQVRDDLVSNNQKVLDYVKNGGTLIVQYQRPDYVARNFQPFPASMTDAQKTTAGSVARVVDENAKVTILDAAHPVFNFPNKISDADFSNWVQERNLYNFVTFDMKYIPLLESHDANEAENKGGMVYAKIGKGNYIYTSYSFFRQLPAGNAGAYRLFANLLSLPKYGSSRKTEK